MSATEVICRQCGGLARLLRTEGQLFAERMPGLPVLFQVIDCPKCGEREQAERRDGKGGTPTP
jgi:hypothetical protein